MNLEQKCLRAGALTIACAILLRLAGSGVLGAAMENPKVAAALLFMETGRMVQVETIPAQTTQPTVATQPQQPQPIQDQQLQPVPEPVVQATFSGTDAALVEVNSVCGYSADVQTLLQMPLNWDLTQDGPAVLILHSHGTESYTKTEDYQESSQYRTLDEGHNMVSVGERIAQLLEAGGVEVLHDKTLHDYPSYSSAYTQARKSISAYLEEYPSIRMVLDIHRDSVELSNGKQARYTVETDGQTAAQLMMVVGTDASGLDHPNWQQNMALAVKLHAQLERETPGICRPISFRKQRFNQDKSTGAMLVEVGSAGNTRQEALAAAELLARGILQLAHGTAGELS